MATKLDWTYESSEDGEIAWHRGYRLKAERDPHASNPFEDQDCHFPIAVDNGERYSTKLTEYPKDSHLVRCALSAFNNAQLVHDQIAIAKVLGYVSVEHIMEAYGTDEPVKYCWDVDTLTDVFEQALDDLSKSAQLDKAAELYTLAGVPAYVGETRGYCQGDWAKVLVVATPEKVKEFGCTELKPDDLKSSVDLYGAWAWGDVYGYVIEEPELDEDGEVLAWHTLDSCWGYYGTDHDASGLDEAAWGALESIIHQRQRARFAKLKELIRNRVPLDKRAQILREAA